MKVMPDSYAFFFFFFLFPEVKGIVESHAGDGEENL